MTCPALLRQGEEIMAHDPAHRSMERVTVVVMALHGYCVLSCSPPRLKSIMFGTERKGLAVVRAKRTLKILVAPKTKRVKARRPKLAAQHCKLRTAFSSLAPSYIFHLSSSLPSRFAIMPTSRAAAAVPSLAP